MTKVKRALTAQPKSNSGDLMDVTKTDWYKESQDRLRHGGLIRILRGHRNMTQADIGKRLGVTSKFVSDLECGRRNVSSKMAKKLSEVFDRKPERFSI